jgi:hypothetical protein
VLSAGGGAPPARRIRPRPKSSGRGPIGPPRTGSGSLTPPLPHTRAGRPPPASRSRSQYPSGSVDSRRGSPCYLSDLSEFSPDRHQPVSSPLCRSTHRRPARRIGPGGGGVLPRYIVPPPDIQRRPLGRWPFGVRRDTAWAPWPRHGTLDPQASPLEGASRSISDRGADPHHSNPGQCPAPAASSPQAVQPHWTSHPRRRVRWRTPVDLDPTSRSHARTSANGRWSKQNRDLLSMGSDYFRARHR